MSDDITICINASYAVLGKVKEDKLGKDLALENIKSLQRIMHRLYEFDAQNQPAKAMKSAA